ncbi:cobalamin-binding protein [Sediminibacillus halophilus]|uniref:Iron complex transport system substrate-binding protein n=1 Tax=Sediminibacillus halophilus TaxID=482461 RepID=A0A1G9PSE4_9BACI|nr:cobalamin-binding protein [Sediminibacillus halophilus]SDM01649.1 iron complex transport system substrate-binding protein [Sediminibacillus halophilus]
MRVVSICPSNTELLDYLGKVDKLIAVDDFSDYPERVKQLPKVGPDLSIDVDKVAAMEPDLVLASLSVPGMEKNIEALDKQQVPYIILNPNSLEEIARDLETTGAAIGEEALGKQKALQFKNETASFRLGMASSYRPSLYWEWWPKPVFTPGRENWLTEISELAGARNIFDSEAKASVQTNWEEVKSRNPDHICLVWVGIQEEKMRPELIKKRPGWNELDAVRQNRIHVLPEALFCRPSPRLLLGLEKLNKILMKERMS